MGSASLADAHPASDNTVVEFMQIISVITINESLMSINEWL